MEKQPVPNVAKAAIMNNQPARIGTHCQPESRLFAEG
jgi:hypothetical protein